MTEKGTRAPPAGRIHCQLPMAPSPLPLMQRLIISWRTVITIFTSGFYRGEDSLSGLTVFASLHTATATRYVAQSPRD